MMNQLKRVKLFIGLNDDSQDELLNEIINQSEIQLRRIIDKDDIPEELQYVVTDLVIMRYNRLGSEGMSSESVEGHSVTYSSDDLRPYSYLLSKYLPDDSDREQGEVLFF